MSKTHDETFWGNFRWGYIVFLALVYGAFDVYQGWGKVETVEHRNWVWSLIVVGVMVYLELFEALNRQKVARLEESLKHWMEEAVARQVKLDEHRFKK